MSGKRVARVIEGLDDGSVVGLYRDALGGERAVPVGSAEWAMRGPLHVQVHRDDDFVEDSLLALERPQTPALREARRDVVQLIPAIESAVGLDNGFEEISH